MFMTSGLCKSVRDYKLIAIDEIIDINVQSITIVARFPIDSDRLYCLRFINYKLYSVDAGFHWIQAANNMKSSFELIPVSTKRN